MSGNKIIRTIIISFFQNLTYAFSKIKRKIKNNIN